MLSPTVDSSDVGSIHRLLLHSIIMRMLIENLQGPHRSNPSIQYIHGKLVGGEHRRFRGKQAKYYTYVEVARAIMDKMIGKYPNYPIETETALNELYYRQEYNFKKYFKLKDKHFIKLFRSCGDELEDETIMLIDDMVTMIKQQSEVFK